MNDHIKQMIQNQLIPRGIHDVNVLSAMEKVKRHLFVEKSLEDHAYDDHPLPIGEGQTISQPFMVAYMTELLQLKGHEKVLEIGTGSGYQTAILAELSKKVYTIERTPVLSRRAGQILKELGYKNIFFKTGDGTEGWQEESPFDRVLITAGASIIPPPLFNQLNEKGIMIIPLGERSMQKLTIIRKINNKMKVEELESCIFVPLIGKYGME